MGACPPPPLLNPPLGQARSYGLGLVMTGRRLSLPNTQRPRLCHPATADRSAARDGFTERHCPLMSRKLLSRWIVWLTGFCRDKDLFCPNKTSVRFVGEGELTPHLWCLSIPPTISRLSSITVSLCFIYEVLILEQYGFRKKLSTELALVDMSDNIARSLDNKKLTIGIFVDLSKAFDTLNHEILIDKLAHYGIRGVAQNWFRSYLENREQFVAINDNRSIGSKISTGVPQGSIL